MNIKRINGINIDFDKLSDYNQWTLESCTDIYSGSSFEIIDTSLIIFKLTHDEEIEVDSKFEIKCKSIDDAIIMAKDLYLYNESIKIAINEVSIDDYFNDININCKFIDRDTILNADLRSVSEKLLQKILDGKLGDDIVC